jgi:agmatine deiminase
LIRIKRAALGRLFPGRKIVGINAEPVNAGGGGLNCISNNMPA